MQLKEYKLGDIAEIVNGSTPSTSCSHYYDGDIVWITPKDLSEQNTKYIKSGGRNITKEGFDSCSTHLIPEYNILLTSRAPIGLLAINQVACCTNQGFKNLIVNKDIVDVDYLYYYLKYHIAEIETLGTGTTFKEVSKASMEKYTVSLPNIEEQKKVSSILSALDAKISLNKQINQNLEALARQLYDYWFVQFDFPNEEGKPYKSSGGKMVYNPILKREIPEGWEVKMVKDYIDPIERGISYSSEEISSPDGVPMINLACYSKQGDYRTGEMKFFSGKIKEEQKVFPYDMFIACTDMTQDADVIGRPILATEEYQYYVYSMDLAKIKPNNIAKMYLYYSLRTPFYHRYIKPFASGTTVKHLKVNGIENYKLTIPPMEIQNRFDRMIMSGKKMQMLILNEIASLTKQRDELLPLLMNGQVNFDLSDD